jgi:hypothetical protein
VKLDTIIMLQLTEEVVGDIVLEEVVGVYLEFL